MNRIDFESSLKINTLLKNNYKLWSIQNIESFLSLDISIKSSKRSVERWLKGISWLNCSNVIDHQVDHNGNLATKIVFNSLISNARKKRKVTLFVEIHLFNDINTNKDLHVLVAVDGKGSKKWCSLSSNSSRSILRGLLVLANNKHTEFFPSGLLLKNTFHFKNLPELLEKNIGFNTTHFREQANITKNTNKNIMNFKKTKTDSLSHLDRLEAESIYIIREVMAFAKNPVMLYSIGKDSAVMLHLAQKAFHPSPPPFL
jgi:sulfate adenylyltransferase subunit 2